MKFASSLLPIAAALGFVAAGPASQRVVCASMFSRQIYRAHYWNVIDHCTCPRPGYQARL